MKYNFLPKVKLTNKTGYKSIVGLLLMLLLPMLSKAQVPATAAAYPFSSSVKTFNYLIGGNAIIPSINVDDAVTNGIGIGFPFQFCSGTYTTCNIGSNGYISFGSVPVTYFVNYNAPGQGIEPAVMPLWDDLGGSGGTATYLMQGTAPNRTFTVEWKNWSWNYSGSPCISFQVILYEGGVIEFMYKSESGSVNNASSGATIGIARNSTDYQTLPNTGIAPTPSSSTYTTSLSSRPTDGQSYVWGILPCRGIPAFDITGPHLVCPSRPFSLSIGGVSILSGITYQWQKSLNGTTWNNYTGAGTTTSGITDAITVKSYYRCMMTCANSGQSFTTPTWDVSIAPFAYCYCLNGATVTGGLDIGNVKITAEPGEQRIALNNGLATPALSNTTASGSYSTFQYTINPVVMYRDSSFKMDVAEITSAATMPAAGNVAAYIDYDQDGIFEASERVMKKTITGAATVQYTGTSTFTVPHTAQIGLTGMRVIISTTNPDSCGFGVGEGEVEDYLVDMRYEPCTSAGNPGTIDAPLTALCSGYGYLLTDTTYEKKKSELVRYWQISGDSIVWYPLNNQTNMDTIMRTFNGQPLFYRTRMICPPANGGKGDTSYTDGVQIKAKAGYKCYCYSQSNGTDKDSTDLGGFTIGDYVVNTGGPHLLNPAAHNRRSDFTDNDPYVLYADSLYHIAAFQTQDNDIHADAKITIFMDFNNNKQYDVPYERVFSNYTGVTNFTVADTFTVPPVVITEVPTGMRVIINNNIGPNDASDLGCGGYESGETQDYIVVFKNKIPAGIVQLGSAINNFGLFPNPTTGVFTVQFNSMEELKDLQISVMSVTGQQIYEQSFTHRGGSFSKQLDLSKVAKGVYFVDLRADGQRVTQKLVIE